MDIIVSESLVLQAIDQLLLVAVPFPSEYTDWRSKNAARVVRELRAPRDRQVEPNPTTTPGENP